MQSRRRLAYQRFTGDIGQLSWNNLTVWISPLEPYQLSVGELYQPSCSYTATNRQIEPAERQVVPEEIDILHPTSA